VAPRGRRLLAATSSVQKALARLCREGCAQCSPGNVEVKSRARRRYGVILISADLNAWTERRAFRHIRGRARCHPGLAAGADGASNDPGSAVGAASSIYEPLTSIGLRPHGRCKLLRAGYALNAGSLRCRNLSGVGGRPGSSRTSRKRRTWPAADFRACPPFGTALRAFIAGFKMAAVNKVW